MEAYLCRLFRQYFLKRRHASKQFAALGLSCVCVCEYTSLDKILYKIKLYKIYKKCPVSFYIMGFVAKMRFRTQVGRMRFIHDTRKIYSCICVLLHIETFYFQVSHISFTYCPEKKVCSAHKIFSLQKNNNNILLKFSKL